MLISPVSIFALNFAIEGTPRKCRRKSIQKNFEKQYDSYCDLVPRIDS